MKIINKFIFLLSTSFCRKKNNKSACRNFMFYKKAKILSNSHKKNKKAKFIENNCSCFFTRGKLNI